MRFNARSVGLASFALSAVLLFVAVVLVADANAVANETRDRADLTPTPVWVGGAAFVLSLVSGIASTALMRVSAQPTRPLAPPHGAPAVAAGVAVVDLVRPFLRRLDHVMRVTPTVRGRAATCSGA